MTDRWPEAMKEQVYLRYVNITKLLCDGGTTIISTWRDGKFKPDHTGLYQVSVNGHAYWSWWDGKHWRGLVDVSFRRGLTPTCLSKPTWNQSYNWRGLIHAPEKPNFTSWKRTNKPKGRPRKDSPSEGVSPTTPRPKDSTK